MLVNMFVINKIVNFVNKIKSDLILFTKPIKTQWILNYYYMAYIYEWMSPIQYRSYSSNKSSMFHGTSFGLPIAAPSCNKIIFKYIHIVSLFIYCETCTQTHTVLAHWRFQQDDIGFHLHSCCFQSGDIVK